MAHATRKYFQEIFTKSQFSVTSHDKLFKQLKQLYDKIPPDAFVSEFTRCLEVPLFHAEKFRAVENTLTFASKFIASLLQSKPVNADESMDDDEEICPFVLHVLQFLFENHNTDLQAIRFRVCQFINKILNGLGNEACIDDNLCDQISECMMERLQDKAPAVRMQAVLALHRLQDPSDANCPVMKAFMFHMSTDTSPDVRRAVITNIAITAQSVRSILERTHDSKDLVRRAAFISLSKLGVQRFTITQRVRLLTDGLKDVSAIVRDSVSKIMLPAWLQFYKNSFLSLLHALDCENSTDISRLALQALFKSEPIKAVLEELTNLQNEDKVIPVKDLSPENVLYWRSLHEYLEAHPEIADDRPIDEPLPALLPELSTFCNYIREYFEYTQGVVEAEHWVRLQDQYTLIQLLELCSTFDLTDEVGRTNLRALCLHFLTNKAVTEDVVPVVVQTMVKVTPNVEDRLQALAEAISEVLEPMSDQEQELAPSIVPAPVLSADELRQRELKQASIRVKINEMQEDKDDAIRNEDFQRAQELKATIDKLQEDLVTLTESLVCPPPNPPQTEIREVVKDDKGIQKCLRVVREMVQSDAVKSLSSTLRSLMQNFVIPCLQEENTTVIRNKALECLGLFCLLDSTLAQENFVMFCFQIANDEVCEVALKVTFDLLLLYGLEIFQIQEENGDTSSKKKLKKKKKNLFVTDMFDDEFDTEEDESQETQTNISSGSSGNTSNLISMLTSLLDSTSISMRNLAMEGLYKLLHACRISSHVLLSRLILMWYSPVTDGDESLRQPLGVFLTVYASHCPRSQETLEQAFLPTLRTLMQAPVTSPLTQIDQDSVARLFIGLTRPGSNKFHSKMSHIHNNMAISICNAIMDCDDNTNIGVLLRALASLELSLDDPIYREELKTLIKTGKELFRASKEKSFLRYLEKISQLIDSAAEQVSMRTTEVDNTAASSQFEATQCSALTNNTVEPNVSEANKRSNNAKLLHPNMSMLSENKEVEDDDEEDSQKTPPLTSSIVIPGSPLNSQSIESEEEDAPISPPNSENALSNKPEETLKATKDQANGDVFKKPASKLKPQRTRNGTDSRAPSASDSDASPVAKRRKADDATDKQVSKPGRPGRGRLAKKDTSEDDSDKEESAPAPAVATDKQVSKPGRPGRGRLAKKDISEDDSDKEESAAAPAVATDKQVSKPGRRGRGRPAKEAVSGDDSGKEETATAPAEKEVSPKRNINPTEKGATLKTFQNIAASKNMSPVESPTSTPPAKRMKKSVPIRASSQAEADSSTLAQPSETSSSSPRKSSPVRPSTRRSVTFQIDRDSLDSPPMSAAQLRVQMAKKAVKSSQKIKPENETSHTGASTSPTPLSSKKPGSGKKSGDKSGPSASSSSSGPEADLDSSPHPRHGRQTKRKGGVSPSQPAQDRSSRSKAEAEASAVPSTRSGRLRREEASPVKPTRKQPSKAQSSETVTTDSDSSPLPSTRGRHRVEQSSPRVALKRLTPSRGVTPSTATSTSDIDSSPAASNTQKRQKGQQIKGIEMPPEKSAKSVPVRSTRRSTSQSDAEGTLQSSDISDNLSPAYSTARQNSDSPPVSAARLKQKLKKTNKPAGTGDAHSNGNKTAAKDLSPSRKSSRGLTGQLSEMRVQASKKRPAQALKSASSDGLDSDSQLSPTKAVRVPKKLDDKSTPTNPEKKSRMKTPSKDSPLPDTSRRSLRSQVETPSPRTRSGKI